MLFGISAPKFIYDPDGTPVEVLLDYVVIEKDEPEEDIIIHESIFTKHREYIIKGKYWIVEMKLHLYKIVEAFGLDIALEYLEKIKSYEGLEVRFYRHRDGDYLKDSLGAEVPMFLESVDESYYQTPDYKDLLYLRFKSTKYVDLTQNLSLEYYCTSEGEKIKTSEDEYVVVRI